MYASARSYKSETEKGYCEVLEADLDSAREFFDYCRSIGAKPTLASKHNNTIELTIAEVTV